MMAQAGKAFAMRPAVLAPLLTDKQAAAALAADFDVELAVALHECDAEGGVGGRGGRRVGRGGRGRGW